MKTIRLILSLLLFQSLSFTYAQSCDELMDYVKSESYGTTYTSYNSEAISKVTFYNLTIDYKNHYFAIVCFKGNYYGCSEYVYKVASNTESNYAMNYHSSAGKAFWKYIEPYSDNLDCSPKLD